MRVPLHRTLPFVAALRALILAGSLGGCNTATAPDLEMGAARLRWNDRGPSDYRVTIVRWCECTPAMTGPVRVEVRDGAVIAREYTATGETVAPGYAGLFPAVPGLFELVADARRRHAARIDVVYDPELGYPVRIAVDYDASTADDEVVYLASELQRLQD